MNGKQLRFSQALKIYCFYSLYYMFLGFIPLGLLGLLCVNFLIKDKPTLPLAFGQTPEHMMPIILGMFIFFWISILLKKRFLYKSITRNYSDFKITPSVQSLPWSAFIYFIFVNFIGHFLIGFLFSFLSFLTIIPLWCWSAYVICWLIERNKQIFHFESKL